MSETSYSGPENVHTLCFQFIGVFFASKEKPFNDTFGSKTAKDWDCVAAIERLTAFTTV